MSFRYLLDKIQACPFEEAPFRHIEVLDFFSTPHFSEIVACQEVAISVPNDDRALIDKLQTFGYVAIPFPGTTQNIDAYLKWRAGEGAHDNNDTCEGFGITFRLVQFRNTLLEDLSAFFASSDFLGCVADKFRIDLDGVRLDNGLQKYLHGYEISPHPDIRLKALTYMVNVNPGVGSEAKTIHTHYMSFKDEFRYVQEYWSWGMHLTPEAPRSSIRALEDYSRTLGSFKSASPSGFKVNRCRPPAGRNERRL